MAANQPSWPRQWLMTDERIGDRLWEAIGRLPEGKAGIVLRHYATPADERARLARRVADLAGERGLTLAIARDVLLVHQLGARLVHNPASDPAMLPVSRSAHSLGEARAAVAAGASLIFLSPLFATRSHPGRPTLSREVSRQIIAECPVPVIALGGMDADRFASREVDGFHGWAGIDAWLGEIRT